MKRIIIENADIRRRDPDNPASALIDSSAFIRTSVGSYRMAADLSILFNV